MQEVHTRETSPIYAKIKTVLVDKIWELRKKTLGSKSNVSIVEEALTDYFEREDIKEILERREK